MDVDALVAPRVREMQSYAPIVPFDVLSKRLDMAVDRIVKLDANENPYGFSLASSFTIRSTAMSSRFDNTSNGTIGA